MWISGIESRPSPATPRASACVQVRPRNFTSARGNTNYRGLGATAVMRVIADVRRRYPVDPDRICSGQVPLASPVVRGVWMLESVLGTPPNPPPPGIEPLSPDLRGARTIREQLEAHRAQESCRRCHDKIDPLGFAFENFDELGLWRTHYKTEGKALPIDPSSILTDGRKIAGIAEMKRLRLGQEEQVARNLTEKLLAFASGRIPGPLDRGEVDRIVTALKTKGYGLRDLIHLVATSDVFLRK